MTELADLPPADTSDMVQMHRVFRKSMTSARGLIDSVPDGDAERAAIVGGYYTNVFRLLHVHHEGEDLLLTPKLLDRLPAHGPVIRSISDQHQEVLIRLEDTERRIDEWQRRPDQETSRELISALTALEAALIPHLDAEEEQVLPLAARCINVMEWGELPGHGLRQFDGNKLWLILGLIRSELSPANLADMDAHLPSPVAAMWAESGKSLYRDYMAQLENPAR